MSKKNVTVAGLLEVAVEQLGKILSILEGQPATAFPRIINDRFTDNGDGTVTDNNCNGKKLTWIRRPHTDLPDQFKKSMNFAEREAACKNLNFAGKTDWRQPNRAELESMRDFSRYNPAVNTEIFPDIKPEWYGTGEEVQGHPDWFWCVGFNYGGVLDYRKVASNYVWPVRSSQ